MFLAFYEYFCTGMSLTCVHCNLNLKWRTRATHQRLPLRARPICAVYRRRWLPVTWTYCSRSGSCSTRCSNAVLLPSTTMRSLSPAFLPSIHPAQVRSTLRSFYCSGGFDSCVSSWSSTSQCFLAGPMRGSLGLVARSKPYSLQAAQSHHK